MEPRNGCRLCMRDLPPGAANSRDGLRRRASPPSGRLTLQILHPPKTNRDWDKSDPTQSTAIDALSASVLSGLFPSRKNLLRGKKTLAVERNVTRYTGGQPLRGRSGGLGARVRLRKNADAL